MKKTTFAAHFLPAPVLCVLLAASAGRCGSDQASAQRVPDSQSRADTPAPEATQTDQAGRRDGPAEWAGVDATDTLRPDMPTDSRATTNGDCADAAAEQIRVDWAGPDAVGEVNAALPEAGMDSDSVAGPDWTSGVRAVSGRAYFFAATGPGQISEVTSVTGAEVFILENPGRRVPVGADGTFRFEGLPDDVEVTLGLEHPDYFPSLTATFTLSGADIENVTFQMVTQVIALFLGAQLGADPHDPDHCQMVTTVTAMGPGQQSVYAPGEPDATVTIEPPPPAANGPFYFNTMTMPDRTLSATTTDGGAMVIRGEPGDYIWTANKPGLQFAARKLRCVGGWLTNAAPPYGLQASPAD